MNIPMFPVQGTDQDKHPAFRCLHGNLLPLEALPKFPSARFGNTSCLGVPNKNISSFHYQHSHCIPVIEFLQPMHWDARARRGDREVAPGAAWPLPGPAAPPRAPAATALQSPHTPRVSPWAQNSTCSQSLGRLAWLFLHFQSKNSTGTFLGLRTALPWGRDRANPRAAVWEKSRRTAQQIQAAGFTSSAKPQEGRAQL